MFSNSERKHSGIIFSPDGEEVCFMQRCLRLAANGEGLTTPNPMVGAVLVHEGRIIGEGWHHRAGEPHAEPNAIYSVRDKSLLKTSTLYVSLEPCSHQGKTPPCADLIIESHIPRVVVGCTDPFPAISGKGISKLREAGIQVTVGVEEQACRLLNRRFFTFHLRQRPHVTLKWAQTRDGYTDRLRDNDRTPPLRLSDGYTATLVHRLRAQTQAILAGRRTEELDHPQLTVRHWPVMGSAQPEKIIMSHRLTGDLPDYLHRLYLEGIQSILVEGGSTLHRSFLDSGLWDEIQVETAPVTLGTGHPAVSLPAFPQDIIHRQTVTCDNHRIDTFVKVPF